MWGTIFKLLNQPDKLNAIPFIPIPAVFCFFVFKSFSNLLFITNKKPANGGINFTIFIKFFNCCFNVLAEFFIISGTGYGIFTIIVIQIVTRFKK